MIAYANLLVALFAPWLVGAASLRLIRLPWLTSIGAGYLLGMILISLLLRLWSSLALPLELQPLLLSLLGMGLIFSFATKLLSKPNPGQSTALNTSQRWLIVLLFSLLVLRLLALGIEIAWRPLFAWDAWASWAVKAKVWFFQQQIVPFVAPEQWLQNTQNTSYTVIGTDYPITIPLLQFWVAMAWGDWQESIINSPWWLCMIALGCGFYGQCRVAGANPVTALIFTYLLLSLPLLNTHAALAGYADLWLASCYGLAATAVIIWCAGGSYQQLILAILLAATLSLLKAEGTIWALSLLVPLLAKWLQRGFWLLFLFVILGAGFWYQAGGITIGSFIITPSLIDAPGLGQFRLFYTDNWQAVADFLLLGGSWHLLWWLVPLCLPALLRQGSALFYATLLLTVNVTVLYILFFFTHAAAWATDGTAINRLFLQIAPLGVFALLLLYQRTVAQPAALSARS